MVGGGHGGPRGVRRATGSKRTLWCLHGNLQRLDVWQSVAQSLPSAAVKLRFVDLWDSLSDSCWVWSQQFCAAVRAYQLSLEGDRQHYLLGYSLGGRLGLHALVAQPELWTGAVIVSADPGTADLQQKERCWERDRTWASRFLTDPWDELLAEWDTLPVFCGYPCTTPRPESDFDRHKIAYAFEAYSKGHMDDLTPQLRQLSLPITYVTGSDDRRYCQLGQTLMTHCPNLRHIQIPEAGHRVPWEQPQKFAQVLSAAIAN